MGEAVVGKGIGTTCQIRLGFRNFPELCVACLSGEGVGALWEGGSRGDLEGRGTG